MNDLRNSFAARTTDDLSGIQEDLYWRKKLNRNKSKSIAYLDIKGSTSSLSTNTGSPPGSERALKLKTKHRPKKKDGSDRKRSHKVKTTSTQTGKVSSSKQIEKWFNSVFQELTKPGNSVEENSEIVVKKSKSGSSSRPQKNRSSEAFKSTPESSSFKLLENGDRSKKSVSLSFQKEDQKTEQEKSFAGTQRPSVFYDAPHSRQGQEAHKGRSHDSPSSQSFSTTSPTVNLNEFLVRAVIILLIALLLANGVLIYMMWDLEGRLLEESSHHLEKTKSNNLDFHPPLDSQKTRKSDDDTMEEMELLNKYLELITTTGHKMTDRTSTSDWIRFLHKQEMDHQIELQRWRTIMGEATGLLRQAEQSLTHLQKGLHPLALQRLREVGSLHTKDLWSRPIMWHSLRGENDESKLASPTEEEKEEAQPAASSLQNSQEDYFPSVLPKGNIGNSFRLTPHFDPRIDL